MAKRAGIGGLQGSGIKKCIGDKNRSVEDRFSRFIGLHYHKKSLGVDEVERQENTGQASIRFHPRI